MATHLEAKPFIIGLRLVKEESEPFPVYRNKNLMLTVSGIGKANAAMACAYSCFAFKPSCIINLGAAGATGSGHAPGEALHVNEAYDYDRPQFKSKIPYKQSPDILDGFPYAKIATLDRAVLDPSERQEISKTADLIDMESASVIQASRKFNTKCYIFKFVSDTLEHTTDDDIIKNIREHRDSFFNFFLKSILTKF
jgi:adenosylhomocysteine nucleosidase